MQWGWYEMKSVEVASKSRKNCTVARQHHYRGGDKRGETVGVRTKIIFANAAIPAALEGTTQGSTGRYDRGDDTDAVKNQQEQKTSNYPMIAESLEQSRSQGKSNAVSRGKESSIVRANTCWQTGV
jgi:hypothetical protein